jgi:CspA family cold shock protein
MKTQWGCTGAVDFFNDTGNYGFITTDAVSEDVFFHLDSCSEISTIQEGDSVRFNYEQAEKGPRVTEMEIISTNSGTAQETVQSQQPGDQLPGEISFYNDTGGYGFISTDVVEEDVFFQNDDHAIDDWAEGRYVLFRYEQAEKGPIATDVRYAAGRDSGGGGETALYTSDDDARDETTKLFDPDNQ